MLRLFIFPKFVSQKGQTIVELLMAVLVVGLVVTAVAIGMTYSVRNTAQARYRESGASLAQEVIEFFRSERDVLGWPAFSAAVADGAVYCVESIPADLTALPDPGPCGTGQTIVISGVDFSREVTIAKDTGSVRLDVLVDWSFDENTPQSLTLTHRFQDY